MANKHGLNMYCNFDVKYRHHENFKYIATQLKVYLD